MTFAGKRIVVLWLFGSVAGTSEVTSQARCRDLVRVSSTTTSTRALDNEWRATLEQAVLTFGGDTLSGSEPPSSPEIDYWRADGPLVAPSLLQALSAQIGRIGASAREDSSALALALAHGLRSPPANRPWVQLLYAALYARLSLPVRNLMELLADPLVDVDARHAALRAVNSNQWDEALGRALLAGLCVVDTRASALARAFPDLTPEFAFSAKEAEYVDASLVTLQMLAEQGINLPVARLLSRDGPIMIRARRQGWRW